MNLKRQSITKDKAEKLLFKYIKQNKSIDYGAQRIFESGKNGEDNVWIVSDSSSGFSNLSLQHGKLE